MFKSRLKKSAKFFEEFFWKVAWHVWSAAQPGTPWQEPHYNLYTRSTMMIMIRMIILITFQLQIIHSVNSDDENDNDNLD